MKILLTQLTNGQTGAACLMFLIAILGLVIFITTGKERTESVHIPDYNEWLMDFMREKDKHDFTDKKVSAELLRAYYDNGYTAKQAVIEILADYDEIGVKPN